MIPPSACSNQREGEVKLDRPQLRSRKRRFLPCERRSLESCKGLTPFLEPRAGDVACCPGSPWGFRAARVLALSQALFNYCQNRILVPRTNPQLQGVAPLETRGVALVSEGPPDPPPRALPPTTVYA